MVASNIFAVSPKRSSDGYTRLWINSHQPWDGPVSWYEAHLVSNEGWDFYGGFFPGSPVPLLGHNKYLGWKVKNRFWYDSEAFIWKSEQHLSPKLPLIQIEVTKKPAM